MGILGVHGQSGPTLGSLDKMQFIKFVMISICAGIGFNCAEAKGEDFSSEVSKILILCNQIALPNSQARPEGFDANEHVKKLENQRTEVSRLFHSAAGVAFIKRKLKTEKDELNQQCLKKILEESGAH